MNKKTGVLVIAHGSRNQEWIKLIENAVNAIETSVPVTIGYLELVEGRSIADGVRYLEKLSVTDIIVIPFFVSSGSTHLNEIKYALGVLNTPAFQSDIELIFPKATITWTQAMDCHPQILQVLEDRIRSLSTTPAKESLLLMAHGSNRQGFQEVWESTLERIVTHFKNKFGFGDAAFATVLPDTIYKTGKKLSRDGNRMVIAIPVFLSEGYYTSKKLPEILEGIPHHYEGAAYLPHPGVTKWLQDQINTHIN
ncbi:cobalamin biosynthesis protein CbiX [Bacillus alkalicola]|uniref:Cobalamin biosynthesis protein CbiX n=2 Tax=Bacillales TaxID=1385 RepID=A0ABS6JW06_9BACI|nr:cobalamin biosynthesis protein CbiX [Bacillus alkalicola]